MLTRWGHAIADSSHILIAPAHLLRSADVHQIFRLANLTTERLRRRRNKQARSDDEQENELHCVDNEAEIKLFGSYSHDATACLAFKTILVL